MEPATRWFRSLNARVSVFPFPNNSSQCSRYLLRVVHADLQGVFAQRAVSRQNRKRPFDLLLPLLSQVLELVSMAQVAPDVL